MSPFPEIKGQEQKGEDCKKERKLPVFLRGILLRFNCQWLLVCVCCDLPEKFLFLKKKPAQCIKEKYKLNKFMVSFSPVGAMCEQENSSDESLKLSFVDTGFNITLKRKISAYLYTYYLPCLAIVVVSQVSFILPLSSIPGRIGLVVTQFLTLTQIFISQMVWYKDPKSS